MFDLSRRSEKIRAMLWAVAILFILNFYMFVAARPVPFVTESAPLVAAVEVPQTVPDLSTPLELPTAPASVSPDARRILSAERERLRKRCIRFGDPRLVVSVATRSADRARVVANRARVVAETADRVRVLQVEQ